MSSNAPAISFAQQLFDQCQHHVRTAIDALTVDQKRDGIIEQLVTTIVEKNYNPSTYKVRLGEEPELDQKSGQAYVVFEIQGGDSREFGLFWKKTSPKGNWSNDAAGHWQVTVAAASGAQIAEDAKKHLVTIQEVVRLYNVQFDQVKQRLHVDGEKRLHGHRKALDTSSKIEEAFAASGLKVRKK
jgi:hypothetical protein